MSKKPRIGVTTRLETDTNRFYLGKDYTEALVGTGAVPVMIPLIPESKYLSELVADLDGILLPGSDTDVDPHRFGEEPHPAIKRILDVKDETDLLILTEAQKRNLPVLGICFGMQVMNVFRGGSLYQDISSQIENSIKHEQGIPLARNSHHIEIVNGSLMSSIAEENKIKVNSHHHQSIKVLGKNLFASSHAIDGVIESIESDKNDEFFFGVQWHPELSWSSDATSRKIFQMFVKICVDNT